MSEMIYEASIHVAPVRYTNFKGETNKVNLQFALDPMRLMEVISSIELKEVKSNNPAKRGQKELRDEDSIPLVRKLVENSAGFPSEDGESWEPNPDIVNTLAGQAFLTNIMASAEARREFSTKVLLAPFRAFLNFSKADKDNTPAEIQELEETYATLERVLSEEQAGKGVAKTPVDRETRRKELEAEMARLEDQED